MPVGTGVLACTPRGRVKKIAFNDAVGHGFARCSGQLNSTAGLIHGVNPCPDFLGGIGCYTGYIQNAWESRHYPAYCSGTDDISNVLPATRSKPNAEIEVGHGRNLHQSPQP